MYFTDPKYGLYDKAKTLQGVELAHSGVYMIRSEYLQIALHTGEPTKQVWLMDGSLSQPNGLAFSPDFSKLYVSNSDRTNPIWKVYDVADTGILKNGRVFFDARELYKKECADITSAQGADATSACANYGAPDGMKVDIHGNLFASGPGGVLVISPEGKLIGRFRLDRPVSNVAFGADGRLYITAQDLIVRVWIKTKPNRVISKL
jgi:gluconolactonase